MIATFLAQYAAGCFLTVSAVSIRRIAWQYLRLMAIVSTALSLLAAVLLVRESAGALESLPVPAIGALACGALLGFAWLFVNAAQREHAAQGQRMWPAAAGLACLTSAGLLALGADPAAAPGEAAAGAFGILAVLGNTLLGAALLGTATAAMLLGHRYLTDTGMTIAPLRRLTQIYLVVIALRGVWVAVASTPVWSGAFRPAANPLYFWMALSVRVGAGIVVAAIFAWMVWDCVRRRATQSATALFYLSMLLICIGELSGQYLMRTERLAL